MNNKEFTVGLGVYYKQPLRVQTPNGDIDNPQLSVINKWVVKKELTDERINKLYAKTLTNFIPTSTVQLPTLNHLEEYLNGSKEVIAERAWEKLRVLSGTLTYVFEDKITQQVIESMSGNIKDFVSWKDDRDKGIWCKKEFIKLYITECENAREIKRKPLLGWIDIFNKTVGDCAYRDENGNIVQGIVYRGELENKKQILAEVENDRIEFMEKEIPKEVISNIGKMIHRN